MLGIFVVPRAKWGRSVALISWIENTNGLPIDQLVLFVLFGGKFSHAFQRARRARRVRRVRAPVHQCMCVLGTY